MFDSQSQCETKSVHLHLISFTTSMWFECVTKVPLTWKSKTMGGIFCRHCCTVCESGEAVCHARPRANRLAMQGGLSYEWLWKPRPQNKDSPWWCGPPSGRRLARPLHLRHKGQSQILHNWAPLVYVSLCSIALGWAAACVINAPKYSRLVTKHCWVPCEWAPTYLL